MKNAKNYTYLSGLGCEFETEVLENALPKKGNAPQLPPYGLYAEQISGSAFTAPRAVNRRSWLYRIRPSALHGDFTPYAGAPGFLSPPFGKNPPDRLRWDPLPLPARLVDIIDGMVTVAGGGDPGAWTGMAAHRYAATASMPDRFFYNADGEMLFVPETGSLVFRTEMGVLGVAPGEICLIPRGVKFAVDLPDGKARGYVCENFGAPFVLPELGPLGANALAYPRHFLTPAAAFEDREGDFTLIARFDGALWRCGIGHAPLDVVAWHGNYAPCKYDLANFNVINTVSFDHPDPSIFTVLTSPSERPGTANVDFAIFPPRWLVAEDTFRPPYFHRNVMSEFMGLVRGVYDAKEDGFLPGGCSLHNCMSAHGPEAAVVQRASAGEQKPVYLKDTLAFMFETRHILRPAQTDGLQKDYGQCWDGIRRRFAG